MQSPAGLPSPKGGVPLSESISAFQAFPQLLGTWLTEHAQAVWWYTALVRFLFPILALLVLVRAIRGLLRVPHTPEQWGQLSLPGGGSLPIDHWENILGRSSSADIRLNFSTVSRQHAALLRDESGSWWVTDLGSKGGTQVNGVQVSQRTPIRVGDTLTVGGVDLLFLPLSREEGEQLSRRRQEEAPLPMWPSLLWLTLCQLLAALQLAVSAGASVSPSLFLLFPGLPTVMWTYYLALRRCGARGFEMETIAFFLSTLSLAVTASSAPGSVLKQFIAILLGLTALVVLGVWLRDTSRTQRLRWLMAAAAIALLSVTLVLGQTRFGAANWIILGPLSFQPSEVAKIFYIFAGSATLERLIHRRNLGLFMVLTGVCLLCLALMSDFGTALIFFATFLVIAYLRSGDFATLSLICGGALFAGLLVLNFKPYIFRRFASWATPGSSPPPPAISRPGPCRPLPPAAWWGWGPERAGCTPCRRRTPTLYSACCARSGACSSPCWRWSLSSPWPSLPPGPAGWAAPLSIPSPPAPRAHSWWCRPP